LSSQRWANLALPIFYWSASGRWANGDITYDICHFPIG
jgi:hypothetical protein